VFVNHFRCLLMNLDGPAADPAGDVAGELIDPAYRKVAVPSELRAVRAALFGAAPDRHMLGYRCRQLLALVHATPLAEYVTALDPRVTYAFADPALVLPGSTGPRVAKRGLGDRLMTYGDGDPPDASGAMHHRVRVTTAAGLTTCERYTPPFSKPVFGTSVDRFDLPGTGVQGRLTSTDDGQDWWVDVYARPARDAAALAAAAERLGEPVYLFLFGVPAVEPYLTFSNLWTRKRELPLRLGALACALAYRTEAVRRAGA
jgi:hypothetical protein